MPPGPQEQPAMFSSAQYPRPEDESVRISGSWAGAPIDRALFRVKRRPDKLRFACEPVW